MMPTDFAFRLSTYLTLGFACACLGYAEWDYLPEVSVFTGLIAAALVVSFRYGSRLEIGLTTANWLGAAIFVIAGGWLAKHWRTSESLIHTLPWPAGLLPYVAPLLLVLMPAKLLRPKHLGDWWAMHGVGLSSVALAASLAEDGFFVVLFALYATAGVWSLSVFFQRRTAGLIPPVPATPNGSLLEPGNWFPWFAATARKAPPHVATAEADLDTARWLIRRPVGWLLVAASVALPLFFLTPRSDGPRWGLSGRMETGYAAESAVDLGRTGTLRNNSETAFEVFAFTPDGRPKDDLPPEQKWRGASYYDYTGGKWRGSVHPQRVYDSPVSSSPLKVSTGQLPDLGPEQFTLSFHLMDEVRSLILADPVAYDPLQPSPVLHAIDGRRANGVQTWDGAFMSFPLADQTKMNRYRQVTRPLPGNQRGMPFVKAAYTTPIDVYDNLRKVSVDGVKRWSRELLAKLLESKRLPPGIEERRSAQTLLPDERDHRAIAEAFRSYLASSGEFAYSTDLKRVDKSLDPVEDFLTRSKSGHCERYAAALTLMLRSVGIPAQFVLGFKGHERIGDGLYVVRQEHAHAWVEAIVPAPGTDPDKKMYQWVTLDPTPAGSDDEGEGASSLWDAARLTGKRFFSDYLIGLNPQTQKKAAAAIRDTTFDVIPWLAGTAVVVACAITFVRHRRRRSLAVPPPTSPVPWFARFVALLERRGLPMRGTPREYAQAAAAMLRARPATAGFAELPLRLSAAVYAQQYAGRTLDPDAVAELQRDVERLADALGSAEGTR